MFFIIGYRLGYVLIVVCFIEVRRLLLSRREVRMVVGVTVFLGIVFYIEYIL